jgi:hypothetical protein
MFKLGLCTLPDLYVRAACLRFWYIAAVSAHAAAFLAWVFKMKRVLPSTSRRLFELPSQPTKLLPASPGLFPV